MKKQELFKELNFLCDKELRKKVNEVLELSRGLPYDTVKYVKTLYPKEVKIIKDFYGIED